MSGLAEAGALARVFGVHPSAPHGDGSKPSFQGDPRFDLSTEPTTVEIPALSETDIQIQNLVGMAVTGLSEFPSGLHFPNRIFYYTGDIVPSPSGQQGMRVAVVNEIGEISMVEAHEENAYGEWNLDSATPTPLTGADIRHYSPSLLDTIATRFTRVMLPVAERETDQTRIEAIKQDLAAIDVAEQTICDLLAVTTGGSTQATPAE